MAVKWTSERGGVVRARVGRLGDLVVAWGRQQKTAPGYEVSAFGVKLEDNSPDEDDGKRRAIKMARRLLIEASDALWLGNDC